MLTSYAPSGKFSAIVFVYVLPLLATVVGAAYLDALLLYWIPFIYIEVFIVVGFAAAVGWATAYMLKIGKCRNILLGSAVGVLAGATAVAAGHYWTYTMTVASVQRPVGFMEYVDARVATGWSIGRGASGGIPISGVFVYIVWLIEAAIVMVGGWIGGMAGAMTPFCESCNIWATTRVLKFTVPGLSSPSVSVLLDAPAVESLLSPPMAEIAKGSPSAVTYTVEHCAACAQTAFLSLEHKETTKDKRGKAQVKATSLHKHVAIAPVHVDALRQLEADVGMAMAK